MIDNKENFNRYVQEIRTITGYKDPIAFGLGIRRKRGDTVLDVLYPKVNFEKNYGSAALFYEACHLTGSENTFASISKASLQDVFAKFTPYHDEIESHANIKAISDILNSETSVTGYSEIDFGVYFLWDMKSAVESTEEAYFKLQLISQREVKPHTVSLDGVFGKLQNIAWTNYGPILPQDVASESIKYYGTNRPLEVSHVDKFPYLLNYHIPTGVRVAAGHKVRLGAHLAEGTTVMQAGFVNFNAGTLGNAMVEGRISAGVVVGKDSDIGGGASIMGTLSGGNKTVISIGENCLLGANAGTGISLGDGSTISAGCYVTAGSKVALYDAEKRPINLEGELVSEGDNVIKAVELSGRKNLLLIQDTATGKLICRPNPKSIELNEALHKN